MRANWISTPAILRLSVNTCIRLHRFNDVNHMPTVKSLSYGRELCFNSAIEELYEDFAGQASTPFLAQDVLKSRYHLLVGGTVKISSFAIL